MHSCHWLIPQVRGGGGLRGWYMYMGVLTPPLDVAPNYETIPVASHTACTPDGALTKLTAYYPIMQ